MSASDPSVTPVAARASTDNLVEIQDVHYSVNGREIFSGLNLAIPRGRITAIMGPSGTGKTTLMRLITGQIRPSSGRIVFDGQDVPTLKRADLYKLRLRMGMLFQNGALLTDRNVFENVAFPLREHTKLPNSLIRHIVLTKLQAVGLRGAAGLEPYALGITSIVVSHDVEELSILADMSYIIAGGKVAAAGSFVDLKDHQSEIVNQFMNGLADGPVAFHYPAPDYFEQLLSRTV